MNFEKWQELIKNASKNAKIYEVHLWNEEIAELKLIEKFGKQAESNWRYGKVVKGCVTDEFIDFLINCKPSSDEFSDKITPFFTIVFDNGFSSEHYGTEMHNRAEKW